MTDADPQAGYAPVNDLLLAMIPAFFDAPMPETE
jgi:hypothetical protein